MLVCNVYCKIFIIKLIVYFCYYEDNMDHVNRIFNSKTTHGDLCLADSATTHTILKDKIYFSQLKFLHGNVNTISGPADLIEGSGRANFILPGGTRFNINNALYSSRSKRNLLSFKDIRNNGYHIETMDENNVEYLCITSMISGEKTILEKLPTLSLGLYYTYINVVESHIIVNRKFFDSKIFTLWHDWLGHPGSIMMHRIIENSHGHSLKDQKIPQTSEFSCAACSLGKLVIRPSPAKIGLESPTFLERIQGDI